MDRHMAKYKKTKEANKQQHEVIMYLKGKVIKYRKQREAAYEKITSLENQERIH